jgi:hypothetical protein
MLPIKESKMNKIGLLNLNKLSTIRLKNQLVTAL